MIVTDAIGAVVDLMKPITIANGYPKSAVDYMAEKYPDAPSATAPFYLYGHRKELNKLLLEKQKDKVFKYQRYPLVALKLDVEESNAGNIINFNLNLAIMTFTNANLDSAQRMEQVFKPILHPLYDRFLKALGDSGQFFWEGGGTPEHTKVDRPFWGIDSAEGNIKHIFSDPIDAVEIIDLKVSQFKCL